MQEQPLQNSVFLRPVNFKAVGSIDSVASVSTTIKWACEADERKMMMLWEGSLGDGLGKKQQQQIVILVPSCRRDLKCLLGHPYLCPLDEWQVATDEECLEETQSPAQAMRAVVCGMVVTRLCPPVFGWKNLRFPAVTDRYHIALLPKFGGSQISANRPFGYIGDLNVQPRKAKMKKKPTYCMCQSEF